MLKFGSDAEQKSLVEATTGDHDWMCYSHLCLRTVGRLTGWRIGESNICRWKFVQLPWSCAWMRPMIQRVLEPPTSKYILCNYILPALLHTAQTALVCKNSTIIAVDWTQIAQMGQGQDFAQIGRMSAAPHLWPQVGQVLSALALLSPSWLVWCFTEQTDTNRDKQTDNRQQIENGVGSWCAWAFCLPPFIFVFLSVLAREGKVTFTYAHLNSKFLIIGLPEPRTLTPPSRILKFIPSFKCGLVISSANSIALV